LKHDQNTCFIDNLDGDHVLAMRMCVVERHLYRPSTTHIHNGETQPSMATVDEVVPFGEILLVLFCMGYKGASKEIGSGR